MSKKLHELLYKYHDLLVYLLLGAATTVVNFAAYYPLHNIFYLSATLSNVIAWIISVLFAFVTNKPFDFKSKDWSAGVTIPEFVKFISCRVGSGVVETVFLTVTVDILQFNGNIMKLLISVLVVIFNYIASKYFVFHK